MLMCEQQGADGTSPFEWAMIQMATVFTELERSMIRSRVMAGLDRVREQGKKLVDHTWTEDPRCHPSAASRKAYLPRCSI
jgi:DNA invertase Pin-like site-specific DNA recombinase